MAYYNSGGGFMASIPPVTKNIVIINLIVFFATIVNEDFMVGTFGLFYPESPYFHWWQPLTYMFMHGGFWHIFFNMYTLVIFGIVLERAMGSRKFLVFFLVTGLGAAAVNMGVQHLRVLEYAKDILDGSASANASYYRLLRTPTVGASGAIYGVLLGYAMLFPNSVLTLLFPPISLTAKWFVLIFAGIEFLTGVLWTSDGVAHFAHLGGMLFGWLLIRFWKHTGRIFRPNEWF